MHGIEQERIKEFFKIVVQSFLTNKKNEFIRAGETDRREYCRSDQSMYRHIIC